MVPSSPNVVGIVKGCGTGCSEMSGHCLMSACIFVVDNGLAILNIVLRPMH